MIRFLDGPLEGRVLFLARAPLFLRATLDAEGKPDALDQLGDAPRDDERVFAYRRVGGYDRVRVQHARKRGGRRCAWLARADYRLAAEQPHEASMRIRSVWEEWCWAQAAAGQLPEQQGDNP